MRITLVEDNISLAKGISYRLEDAGHAVNTLHDGSAAQSYLKDDGADLVILDINLPGTDGLTLLSDMRKRGDARPVILLTARADTDDRVRGLDAGADDYLIKPFEMAELEARVRALLRRAGGGPVQSDILRAGDLTLDRQARTVTAGEQEWELTPMEFALLNTLMSNPGRAFSRMELLERAQGFAYDGYERTIDVHIKNLRKKIETDPANPRHILTVFGVGYRFNANP